MLTTGIDVSKWQGNIDWKDVKNCGVKFAIVREGWGKKSPSQIDKYFKANYNGAKENGIPVGVYHYSYADSADDAKREAEFCLENIRGLQLEYPVCFDIEDKEQLKLSTLKRTDIVKAFCSEIESAGYYAMFYCNLNWLNHYLYKDELLPKYDLWLAQWYAEKPAVTCGIWQLSDKSKVDGIAGNVDANIAYKDYPTIIKSRVDGIAGNVDVNIAYKDYPTIIKNSGLNGFSKLVDAPAPLYYTVARGDTLTKIAQRFSTTVERLVEWNGIKNKDLIYAGQNLRVN